MVQIGSTEQGIQSFCEWLAGKSKKEQNSFVQAVKRFFEKIADILNSLVGRSNFNEYQKSFLQMQEQQLQDISKQWLSALDTAAANSKQKNNTANNGSETKYSIREIKTKNKSYGMGVYLDTNMFENIERSQWNNAFINFVHNNLAGTQIEVFNENGTSEIIEFAKRNERVKKDGVNNSHKVIDKLARKKGLINKLAVIHIDELLSVAKSNDSNTEHSHQWLDENGWEFKTAYIQTKNGNIYMAILNIANTIDGRKILYDVNRITEVGDGDVAIKGSHINLKPTSVDINVPQNDTDVNNNSMQGEAKHSFNVDSEGNGKNKQKPIAKKKKTVYNEYISNAMSWAHSPSTNIGDTKILNQNGKAFALIEATEDGFVEIAVGKYDEVKDKYVQIHGKTDNSFYEYSRQIRSKRNGSMRSYNSADRGRDDVRNSGLVGGERIQNNTTRNTEHLRSGDKETSEQVKSSLDVEREIRQLTKQNEQLEIANEKLKQEFQLTHGRVTDERSAKSLAIWLKKQWQTAMSNTELADELVKLSNDGANGGYATYDDLYDKAHVIANKMLDAQKRGIDPEAKEILNRYLMSRTEWVWIALRIIE